MPGWLMQTMMQLQQQLHREQRTRLGRPPCLPDPPDLLGEDGMGLSRITSEQG